MSAKKKPDTVDSLRAERIALKAELAGLDRQQLGAADVAADVAAAIDAMADVFATRLDVALARIAGGQRVADVVGFLLDPLKGQHVDAVALFGMLGAVNVRDALLARLDGQLAAGPSRAERAARVAEIERRLHDIEVAEEALIVEADSAGTPIPRRDDCDIAVVLGYTPGAGGPDLAYDDHDPTPADEIAAQQALVLGDAARERAALAARPVRSAYLARSRE